MDKFLWKDLCGQISMERPLFLNFRVINSTNILGVRKFKTFMVIPTNINIFFELSSEYLH